MVVVAASGVTCCENGSAGSRSSCPQFDPTPGPNHLSSSVEDPEIHRYHILSDRFQRENAGSLGLTAFVTDAGRACPIQRARRRIICLQALVWRPWFDGACRGGRVPRRPEECTGERRRYPDCLARREQPRDLLGTVPSRA